jgi:hypothetical protein
LSQYSDNAVGDSHHASARLLATPGSTTAWRAIVAQGDDWGRLPPSDYQPSNDTDELL